MDIFRTNFNDTEYKNKSVFSDRLIVVKEGRILKNSFDDHENYKISSQE
jgi:hypothetical protein